MWRLPGGVEVLGLILLRPPFLVFLPGVQAWVWCIVSFLHVTNVLWVTTLYPRLGEAVEADMRASHRPVGLVMILIG